MLKGLQLKWDDGVERNVGHQEGFLDNKSFDFEDDEVIDDMTISGARNDPPGRADSIRFHTTNGNIFFVGGDGGYPQHQVLGTGVLYGFDGAADADIDSLEAIVQE